ncbi:T-lymphocyte surface antigen Ly-9-like [Lepisosteus oculatus]|uniref:T-lymphocyte surface antigen Ly-9-like n=1 Tax=Lepisosteus oculatus TaxID=7918 RepID=UPI0037207C50
MIVILLYVCWISGTQLSPTLQREVKGIVGESVTFPSVQVSQFIDLKQGDSATVRTVAEVFNGTITNTQPDFKDRVTWDNQCGFFQIWDLRTNDSGVYTVQSLDTQKNSTFNLTVFNRVSKPQVSRVSQGSESCSLLCSVSNGREVTLSWQREGKTLNHTSNPDLNTPLTLPLETGLSHSYSCVASNPVSNETVPVTPEEHCFDRVSKPQVSRVSQVSDRCSLVCSVSNGREVTLSWQREGETLTNTSNPDLNTTLTLPLETEGLSHSYSCVASNPVSTETLPVRPEDHCLDRVSRPQVSRVSQGSESCSLLCSVSNGREVTLSWQREGETLNHTSNPDLNTPLTLPLETEGLSHSYSCVASNPVSNETVPVRPEEHCFGADDKVLLYAGAAGGGAVCLGIVALVLYCRLRGKKPRDEDSSPTNNGALGSGPAEVTYAALDMKRLKKPTSVPPAGEDHTVYAEVTGGGRMQGSHYAPEPPPAAGTLASECTEYARVNFRRKTRRAQDAVLYY